MSLLNNAISSLHVALEDYPSAHDGRMLSVVRNLHAGILLLYKEKLRLLSPPNTHELLLKAKHKFQSSAGQLVTVGVGRNTVDVQQIKERFDALGISTDWKRFERVNELRKDIEHYYTTVSRGAIREMVSDTFIIIRNFIKTELQEDPKTLLGDTAWATLISVSEVYQEERKACEAALSAVIWDYDILRSAILELRCSACGSSLLSPFDSTNKPRIQCRSCGEDEDFEDYAERAIFNFFDTENFQSLKDGGDPATITCPHCQRDGYLVEDNHCILCDESCETECSICGCAIPVEELSDGSLCSFCDHSLSKDD